jgi:hypothetical protein
VCRGIQRDGYETVDWIWWIATNNARGGVGCGVTLKRESRSRQYCVNAQ